MKDIIEKIRKRTPIETRIKVAIEAYFIMKHGGSFFMPASEEGEEYEEICRINSVACEEAKPLIETVLKDIDQWVEDGMPK